MAIRKDFIGLVFGKLTVISNAGKDKRMNTMWLCRCNCGGEKVVKQGHLSSLHVTSCGCRKKEMLVARNTTHGESHTKLYARYSGIIQRCEYHKHISYKCHGGRGISVCNEWRLDFANFKEWAEQNGFSEDLVLDRIDSDGNYCPENCRWVSRTINNQNARTRGGRAFRGVKKHLGKFRADIYVDKKAIFLGLFADPVSAAKERNRYIVENKLNHKLNIIPQGA